MRGATLLCLSALSLATTRVIAQEPSSPTVQSTTSSAAPKISSPRDPAQAGNAQVKRPQIERLDEARLKLGALLINRKSQEVTLPAKVNLTRGILEYYAVSSNGKLHESILELDVEPSHLHLAMILAGYEPSEYGPQDPKTYRRPLKKRGSLVKLYVRWTPPELGSAQWLPASVWLFDRSIDHAPEPLLYVFQGSVMSRGSYMADYDRSVIGLIPDETTVLAPSIDKGNPYRGDANGYEAHTSALPVKGTPVELVIRPASHQEQGEVRRYVEALKRIKEASQRAQQANAGQLPAPSFVIRLPSSPSSSWPYEDLP